MSEWDKNLIAKACSIAKDENTECTIIIATNVYDIGINNLDIRLVIQWDIPIICDLMIQQIGRARKKDGASIFILFILKRTQNKD